MASSASCRLSNSAIFTSLLLVSTSLTAPAFGQIETVVVTAEKKAEDIQTVPIAVTAFSSQDLKSHQIVEFKDLVFATPNVTYSTTNFTGADFQIRGIGIVAVAGDAESGVAVHENEVYLADPPLAEANFYDLDHIEILRGPQSTLYGRGATGGSINVITAKPQLDGYSGSGEITYGNYNQVEVKGMVNIPIIDGELGVRLAGDYHRHDGFALNINDGSHINDGDTYSYRGSIRWEPSTDTTVDIVGSFSKEDDSKMRAQKQLCTRDPTGILGCLPGSAGTEALNVNAQFTNTIASEQGLANAFGSPLFGLLGLFDLTQPAAVAPGNSNPSDFRKVNTDFNPVYHAKETFVSLNVKHTINSWLNATLVAGYEDHSTFSQESYNNVGTTPLNQARLGQYSLAPAFAGTALGTLDEILSGAFNGFLPPGVPFSPAYAALYAPFFSVPGALPESKISPTGIGLTSGNILTNSPNQTVYDQSDGFTKQYSAELRFQSNFQGPLNFLVAGYYLRTSGYGDYYVPGNVIDYPGIVLGALLGGLKAPGLCGTTGCILGPSYYHNFGRNLDLESKAAFGEVYYDIIPDELKLTVGARFTDDHKSENDRIAFVSGLIPIGSQNENAALAALVAQGQVDFDPFTPGPQLFQSLSKSFDKWTGRAVLNWTPKLDFTDQTTVYGSYSRGYKSGGFNPGVQSDITAGIVTAFAPEGVDAFEIGTKNTFLDGTLQANLDAWYYNYEGMQVSAIIQNTSVNSNINARMWGAEGEFLWAPDDNWTFNLSFGHTHSALGNTFLVDPRDPSAGRSDTILIKDATATGGAGQNCVVYRTAVAVFQTPADAGISGYFAPAGGSAALAGSGIPLANFGLCVIDPTTPAGLATLTALNNAGFSLHDPLLSGTGDQSGGAGKQLKGNAVPNTPPWTLAIGGQYAWKMDNGFSLVPRVDFYWQDSMWGRVFEDGADRIKPFEQVNMQVTLNSPDNQWYVQAFAKNLTDSSAITGEYLTSSTSALYTNAFLVDPRTFGVRVGAKW